jgi:hypothetical protein
MLDQPLPAQHLDRVRPIVDDAYPAGERNQQQHKSTR